MALMLSLTQMAAAEVPRPQKPVTILDGDRAALGTAVRNLCGRQIALLGEAPTHGDGHTAAFKVALVRQLISRCHFKAVIFESGRYEFLAFQRAIRRGTATPSMLADAVGGLWKFDREFQPLVDFLYAQAKTGRVQLAGMDSQIGGLDETYTNEQMVPELTQSLPAEQASACNDSFARHVAWSYPADHPYGQVNHDQLLTCVAAMRRAFDADKGTDQVTRAERETMIDNLEWAIGPDLSIRSVQVAAREQWLFRNFVSFAATLPQRSKIIVWGATVHLARNVAAISSPGEHRTLGERLHELYPGKAFTLGFSAKGGRFRVFQQLLPIDPPPLSSLETNAMGRGNATAVYLDKRQLDQLGVLPGGALGHAHRLANWADVVDGMVIFREEWPTHSTRPGYF
jgi:erythromycin esterase-like protein